MEKILILGAGLMQKKAILSAKKIAKAVVIDKNPFAPCVSLSDEFYPVDLKDKEGILALAKKLSEGDDKLIGIFTAGTDFSSSVSYAAEKLNLPCHSYISSLNASDKKRMRKIFQEKQIPSAKFISFSKDNYSFSSAQNFALSLGFPVVVKPSDNMGSRGCRIAENSLELEKAVEESFKFSSSKTVIIEEFLDGKEFSIDALVYEDSFTVTGFASRHIFYPPYFIEMGHTLASLISEEDRLNLISTFALAVKSLGLSCGAAKADIKLTSNGPRIGEIAARLSGGYMSGWTFPYSSGFDLTEQALKIACSIKPEKLLSRRKQIPYLPPESCKNFSSPFNLFEIPQDSFSAERAWISIPGTVKDVLGLSEAEKVSGIMDVIPLNLKHGEKVSFPRNNVSKCGNVISKAETLDSAVSSAEKAVSKIIVRLKENDEETEKFLNSVFLEDEKNFPPDAYSFYQEIKNDFFPGTILKNLPVKAFIPEKLKKYFSSSEKSWNYLTLSQSISVFDEKFPNHPDIPCDCFFKALFRGGLQAIIYVLDSISENNKG